MKVIYAFIITFSILISSCSVESEEINYGKEACYFCQMTIIDKQHAAEVVTAKGKVFKFDSIECMINDLKKKEGADIALLLINDFTSPGTLTDANTATYLISEQIKSPMGAFLSGFKSKDKASQMQKEVGGSIYTWTEVQEHIN
ncbi:MAG: nitrous oxide reductase accessory protein NosL [Cyclobacteriaceae bacterium]|nr:nitrous oxide reductase accessory protein NosL [Cyclobacteriaceae bacterium]